MLGTSEDAAATAVVVLHVVVAGIPSVMTREEFRVWKDLARESQECLCELIEEAVDRLNAVRLSLPPADLP